MEESLSIVMPVYNEEGNIKNVLSDVFFHISKYLDNFEVIVVDDGSVDNTRDILSEMKDKHSQLRIAFHDRNKGYGSAIGTGIRLARKGWILIMDSDGQYEIKNLHRFWLEKNGYDLIAGQRTKRRDNLYRICLGRIGTGLANLFLASNVKDINCGFKLFRAHLLKDRLLVSSGNSIHFEILFYLLKSEVNFVQLPVTHYSRRLGKSTGGSLKVILDIISCGFKIVYSRKRQRRVAYHETS